MPKKSAGLLLFRVNDGALEVLLVHPGGPYWAGKDAGAWSIPKGEYSDEEEALHAAVREASEETGARVTGDFMQLEPRRQASGKIIYAWAVRSHVDPAKLRSNTFTVEWPPRSGRQQSFPEVDRAAWFDLDTARTKIVKGQVGFINELARRVSSTG